MKNFNEIDKRLLAYDKINTLAMFGEAYWPIK